MNRVKKIQYVMLGVLAQPIIGFFISVVLIKILSVQEFGFYSLLISLITTFYNIFNLGLAGSMLYFLPSHKNKQDYFRGAFILSSLSLLVFLFSMVFLSKPLQQLYNLGPFDSFLIVTGTMFTIYFFVVLRSLEAEKKFKVVMFENIGVKLFKISSIIMVLLGFGYSGAVFGEILGYALALILGIFWLRKLIFKEYTKNVFKELLSYSVYIYFSSIFIMLIANFPLLYFGLISIDWVAYINLAVKITSMIGIPATAIVTVFTPEFAEGKKNLLNLSNRWVIVSSIFFGLLVLTNIEFFVRYVFSAEYLIAMPVISLYSIGYTIMAINYGMFFFFVGTKHAKLNLIIKALETVLIVSTLVLISPLFGVESAGISLILAESFALIIYSTMLKRKGFVFPYKVFFICVFGGFLGYLSTQILDISSLIIRTGYNLVVCSIIYLCLMLLTKTITKDDISNILEQLFQT